MGAVDNNDAVKFDDAFSEGEREVVYTVIGRNMTERWLTAQSIYLSLTPNVTFVTYGQVGHWTNGRMRRDMVNFLQSAIEKDIREN